MPDVCCHGALSDHLIPRFQGPQVTNINEVIGNHSVNTPVDTHGESAHFLHGGRRNKKFPFLQNILPADRAGGNNRAISNAYGTNQAALSAQEDRRLIQHYPMGHIADQRGCGLVLMRREIEMNVGRADFAVIFSARSARHQGVAEINQTARRHIGQEQCLLEADGMRSSCLFFHQRARPHMRRAAHIDSLQESSSGKKTAFQFNMISELAIFEGNRRLAAEFGTGSDGRFGSGDPAARVNDYAGRNAIGVNRCVHLNRTWAGDDNPFLEQTLNGWRYV